MKLHQHSMPELFQQLGLGSSAEEMQIFISKNSQKVGNLPIYQMDFWSMSQASFLKQALEEDADWSEVVDQLNVMLRD